MVIICLLFFPLLELSFSKSFLLLVGFPSRTLLSCCQMGSPTEGVESIPDAGLCRSQADLWRGSHASHRQAAAFPPWLNACGLSLY